VTERALTLRSGLLAEIDRRGIAPTYWATRDVVAELFPKEAVGDVSGLAALAALAELTEDALRAAYALGGERALRHLILNAEST
jgi:hypothetical protein